MEIKIVDECGKNIAFEGMLYSFQEECRIEDIAFLDDIKANKVAKKLCKKDLGHSKFLEQIQVWMIIRGSLDWWKQFDTYRVGTSKLSKSTMHTIMRKPISSNDFSELVDQRVLDIVEEYRKSGDFLKVSKNLPQGFMQTRMVNTNYKVIRNIIMQRKGHKLPEWEFFIDSMMNNLENSDLLGIDEKERLK